LFFYIVGISKYTTFEFRNGGWVVPRYHSDFKQPTLSSAERSLVNLVNSLIKQYKRDPLEASLFTYRPITRSPTGDHSLSILLSTKGRKRACWIAFSPKVPGFGRPPATHFPDTHGLSAASTASWIINQSINQSCIFRVAQVIKSL